MDNRDVVLHVYAFDFYKQSDSFDWASYVEHLSAGAKKRVLPQGYKTATLLGVMVANCFFGFHSVWGRETRLLDQNKMKPNKIVGKT